MERKEFTENLLKIAFAATVCDGDIDDSELEVIHALKDEDFYLKDEDLSEVLNGYEKDAADSFLDFASNTLKECYNLDFTATEKMIVMKLAIAVVRADGKIEEEEISFIKSLMLNLQIPEEIVIAANGNWWIIQNTRDLNKPKE